MAGGEAEALAVGGEGQVRGDKGELAQGGIQETEVHQKGVAGKLEYVAGEGLGALLGFGHGEAPFG